MDNSNGKILSRMLDRLFAGLVSGPNLNCRPHSSRQRVDFAQLGKLKDVPAEAALTELLANGEVKLAGRAAAPKRPRKSVARGISQEPRTPDEAEVLSPEEKAIQDAWSDQQAVLSKLRILAEEARTYRQDTGVHVLNIGLPLLSLPPGALGKGGARGGSKRVLAPIAFLPVEISLRTGANPTIQIVCQKDGEDVVLPNLALFAWLEQQTGQAVDEAILDEVGPGRWEQVCNLVRHAAQLMNLAVPEFLGEGRETRGEGRAQSLSPFAPRPFSLVASPRSDDDGVPAIVPAAVLGLFPMHNQGLLRDTKAMLEEKPAGPIESFLRSDVSLDEPPDVSYEHDSWSGQKKARAFGEERLVTLADPCQARAVRLARDCRGLVIHGPPGTGKSQTITNIIGDHLARGQRVLMVCDKRTALDVVANRLEHLGLGGLVAVIHDPRHDQRDLYRKLRDQIENLTELRTDPWAKTKLDKIDLELQRLHDDLAQYWKLLMARDSKDGNSFHELIGQWLEAPAPAGLDIDGLASEGANLSEFERHEANVRDILERAEKAGHSGWMSAAGIGLDEFLARPMNQVRQVVQECAERARQVDASADVSLPPLNSKVPLTDQVAARPRLAEQIERVLSCLSRADLARWTMEDMKALRRSRNRLTQAATLVKEVQRGPLDPELAALIAEPSLPKISRNLGMLEAYLEVADRWYGFIFFRRRAMAGRVIGEFGLPPHAASARRLRDFFKALRARLALHGVLAELRDTPKNAALLEDETLLSLLDGHELLLDILEKVQSDPALDGLLPHVRKALENGTTAFAAELRKSAARAEALAALESLLAGSRLFAPSWLEQVKRGWYAGKSCAADLISLADKIDSLESVLRIRHGLSQLPAWLRGCVQSLLIQTPEAAGGLAACRKAVLSAEVRARLRGNPHFQAFDPHRLQGHFERYRTLEQDKQALVRDTVLHHWITRQQERLLVGTGSRLNSQGADLRRRLTMRGEQALRLRQVIAVGQKIDGGDPLFDLCPVWLASPETVAQVFPRQPMFDVVVFDEASQCRLEEALPILTRAGRVVIAGDPRQLPPTRFFESTLSASADDDIETDQDLFEAHQAEIEDLLGAALSIDIQQCYLDVHYRSRNADLIEFSNQQFYSRRLQAIPGHPANRVRFPPITLYPVQGTYAERTNDAEADKVCQIVRDLLKRAEPPSIGIASFNLTQRDLILEKLDEAADQDREFAGRLAEARARKGAASFEGLFVKNLENVQGDERDHIIISTTYGPDPQGRFYRRFGPLGRAGGGRRLNVLVTRARHEIHLVTSIPASAYRGLPPVPAGQSPGGGWLLFAYLSYAEQMAEAYEAAHHQIAESSGPRPANVQVTPSESPSRMAVSLARTLAENHAVGSTVPWGNEGFCIDLALHHPRRHEDVTLGVLCDGVRFAQAEDPVEWDVFRTGILEGQGWRLHRLWSPDFFRDPDGNTRKLLREMKEFLREEEQQEAGKER